MTSGMVQGAIGTSIGGMMDYLFPAAEAVTGSNLLKVFAETSVQLLIDAYLTAMCFEYTLTRGWIAPGDPSRNIIFYATMWSAQPHLASKIQAISSYVFTVIGGFYFSGSSEQIYFGNKNIIQNPVNQDNSSPLQHKTNAINQPGDFANLNEEF